MEDYTMTSNKTLYHAPETTVTRLMPHSLLAAVSSFGIMDTDSSDELNTDDIMSKRQTPDLWED